MDKESHSDGGGHHHEGDGHQHGMKEQGQKMEMATMMATMKGWPPGRAMGTRKFIAMEMATTMKGMGTIVKEMATRMG